MLLALLEMTGNSGLVHFTFFDHEAVLHFVTHVEIPQACSSLGKSVSLDS
jgi:cystathionine beta-lyase/cystathionine gamma-synthase